VNSGGNRKSTRWFNTEGKREGPGGRADLNPIKIFQRDNCGSTDKLKPLALRGIPEWKMGVWGRKWKKELQ